MIVNCIVKYVRCTLGFMLAVSFPGNGSVDSVASCWLRGIDNLSTIYIIYLFTGYLSRVVK